MRKRVEIKKRKKKQKKSIAPLLLIVGGFVVLVATLALSFFNSAKSTPKVPLEVSGSPALRVDKEKVDLGDIKLGKTVQVSFTLTNVGDKTLKLTDDPYVEVKEGC